MSQTSSGKTVMVQGRIVWVAGDLFKGKQKIDQNTRQPKIGQDGSPMMEYGFGLAIPKTEMQAGRSGYDLWLAIHEEAYQIYPSRQVPPSFAWKYKDGNGVDHNGASFAQREGYDQNLVFALTTSIPIKFFRFENGTNIQIPDGIKCGDYVQVQVQVKAHGPIGQGKPGLYLNPMAVLFLGYGKEIINTPTGDQIFGTQAPTIPQGASATPIAPSNAPLVGTGVPTFAQPGAAPMPQGYGAPAAAPQAFPGPGAASVPQQPATPPHYGVLPQAHQPQMPPAGNVAQPGYAQAPATAPQQGFQQPGFAGAQPATPTNGMPPMPGGMPMPR